MLWIQEVELVDSVDDLKSSYSATGIRMPNFEVFDARIVSALNRIIHNPHFKRTVLLEEKKKAQKEDRFSEEGRYFKRTVLLEEQKAQKETVSPRKADRLLHLRLVLRHWSQRFCRELCRPIHYWSSKFRYSGSRFEM